MAEGIALKRRMKVLATWAKGKSPVLKDRVLHFQLPDCQGAGHG